MFASWHALIVLRRATFAIPQQQRRWSNLPKTTLDIVPILNQMELREEIAHIPSLRNLYQVTVPYARTGPLDEYEIVMELHPFCVLSHASALSFHNLTDDFEKRITVITTSKPSATLLPSGTTVEDWEQLKLPSGTKAQEVLSRPVKWIQIDNLKFFGASEYRRFGYPLRVTDRERTLLDGLTRPELCGGIENVLRAWVRSRDVIIMHAIFEYVDRFDSAILRQRAGFVLETLGITHPEIEKWRNSIQRGGSSKLLASAPYSPPDEPTRYSEEWNLAINAPIAALEEFET